MADARVIAHLQISEAIDLHFKSLKHLSREFAQDSKANLLILIERAV